MARAVVVRYEVLVGGVIRDVVCSIIIDPRAD